MLHLEINLLSYIKLPKTLFGLYPDTNWFFIKVFLIVVLPMEGYRLKGLFQESLPNPKIYVMFMQWLVESSDMMWSPWCILQSTGIDEHQCNSCLKQQFVSYARRIYTFLFFLFFIIIIFKFYIKISKWCYPGEKEENWFLIEFERLIKIYTSLCDQQCFSKSGLRTFELIESTHPDDTPTCCLCNSIAGFEILAFPCNQFGGQEPGSNPEIKQFACTRFKAEFPIFDKVSNCNPLHITWLVESVNQVLNFVHNRLMLMGQPLLQFTSFWSRTLADFWVTWSSGTLRSFWWTKMVRLSRDISQQHHLSRLRYVSSSLNFVDFDHGLFPWNNDNLANLMVGRCNDSSTTPILNI